jgi:hypothetical protein
MATHRISVLNFSTVPDDTGRAWFESYDILATNDNHKHMVGVFEDPAATEEHGIFGRFTVPKDYDSGGTTKWIIVWTSAATSGNVEWAMDYRSVAIGETLDSNAGSPAGYQQAQTVTDAAPATLHYMLEAQITPTASNFAVDDEVEFFFHRDGVTGTPNDTMAASAILFNLIFEYTTA